MTGDSLTAKELERYEIIIKNYENPEIGIKVNEVKYFFLINERVNTYLSKIKESTNQKDWVLFPKAASLDYKIWDLFNKKGFYEGAKKSKGFSGNAALKDKIFMEDSK